MQMNPVVKTNGSKHESPASGQEQNQSKHFRTIHDHVETWTDTCSCEAEPRWQAVKEELEAATKNSVAM